MSKNSIRNKIRRAIKDRPRIRQNSIKASGKAKVYQQENRKKMTNAEWACDQLLRDIKREYPQVDYEFQYLFSRGKITSQFFLIDFYIKPPFNFAIEIDGEYHNKPDQAKYDAWRQDKIQMAGIRVLRFRNQDVCLDCDRVKKEITRIVESSISHGKPQIEMRTIE